MADDLSEYEADEPVPHTVLLSTSDAERFGDRYRKKEAAPQNKARTTASK